MKQPTKKKKIPKIEKEKQINQKSISPISKINIYKLRVLLILLIVALPLIFILMFFTPPAVFVLDPHPHFEFMCKINPSQCLCETSCLYYDEHNICVTSKEDCSIMYKKTEKSLIDSQIDYCNKNPEDGTQCKCQKKLLEITYNFKDNPDYIEYFDTDVYCTGSPPNVECVTPLPNGSGMWKFDGRKVKTICINTIPLTPCEKGTKKWFNETRYDIECSSSIYSPITGNNVVEKDLNAFNSHNYSCSILTTKIWCTKNG